MVDEFRSHASIEDKMSFICADGETGKLIDVLPTRKLPRLTSYFLGCTNPERSRILGDRHERRLLPAHQTCSAKCESRD